MSSSRNRFSRLIATALSLSVLTGCMGGSLPYFPEGVPGGLTYGAADADGFRCPYGYNVIPDYDSNLDGTEFYTLCYKEDDREVIRVSGSTANSPSICIYPVEVIDADNVYVKPDLATGGLLKRCVTASSNDGFYSKTYYDFKKKEARFEGTSFNAVFIIKAKDQAQMESCLNGPYGPNMNSCPDFSWGKFRQ